MPIKLDDFLSQGDDSVLSDELEQQSNFVEVGTQGDHYEEEEPQVRPEHEPPLEERPEYLDWIGPKLTPEELKAKADLETLKYSGIIQGALTATYTMFGLMPEPLSAAEQMLYDDYILERAKARKRGETYMVDKDDPVLLIYKRKIEFDSFRQDVKLTPEQTKMLTKAIYVTLHGKNERHELGQMSIAGVVTTIALAKAAPYLNELIPVITSYIKKGVDKMKNPK